MRSPLVPWLAVLGLAVVLLYAAAAEDLLLSVRIPSWLIILAIVLGVVVVVRPVRGIGRGSRRRTRRPRVARR